MNRFLSEADQIPSTRLQFLESWIWEAPERGEPRNDFTGLVSDLTDFLDYYQPIEVHHGIKILQTETAIYAFVEKNNRIEMVVRAEKTPQALQVKVTGKNPTYRGPPYATDLYAALLNQARDKSLILTSDSFVTDKALDVWQRLHDDYTITACDTSGEEKPQKVETLNDFYRFWGQSPPEDPTRYKRYLFVLSESATWLTTVRENWSDRTIVGDSYDNYYENLYVWHYGKRPPRL